MTPSALIHRRRRLQLPPPQREGHWVQLRSPAELRLLQAASRESLHVILPLLRRVLLVLPGCRHPQSLSAADKIVTTSKLNAIPLPPMLTLRCGNSPGHRWINLRLLYRDCSFPITINRDRARHSFGISGRSRTWFRKNLYLIFGVLTTHSPQQRDCLHCLRFFDVNRITKGATPLWSSVYMIFAKQG